MNVGGLKWAVVGGLRWVEASESTIFAYYYLSPLFCAIFRHLLHFLSLEAFNFLLFCLFSDLPSLFRRPPVPVPVFAFRIQADEKTEQMDFPVVKLKAGQRWTIKLLLPRYLVV